VRAAMVNESGSIRMARFRPGADRRGCPVAAGERAVACAGAPPAIETALDLVGSVLRATGGTAAHALPLAEFPAAIPLMRSAKGLKVLALPHWQGAVGPRRVAEGARKRARGPRTPQA
jgi:hypothetical protein